MARTVAIGAILEVSYAGKLAGQKTLTVLHYSLTALAPGPTVDGDLITAAAAGTVFNLEGPGGILAEYLECISQDFELSRIRYQWVNPVRYSYIEEIPVTALGLFVGASMPPNIAAVVGKRNDSTGRLNRGSVHLPGVPVVAVEDGLLTSPATSRYADYGSIIKQSHALTFSGGTATITPVIYHAAVPSASPSFNAFIVMPEVRIMRRRTVGVGE